MSNGVQNLYDYETWLEDAFGCALIDKGLAVLTPHGMFEKFQDARPRVQLRFVYHSTKQGYGPDGFTDRHASHVGSLQIKVIANAESGGNPGLRRYRAEVRNSMQELRPTSGKAGVNGTRAADAPTLIFGDGTNVHIFAASGAYLDFHFVQNIIEGSNTPIQEPENGVEAQDLDYQIDFGVIAGAWVELANNP